MSLLTRLVGAVRALCLRTRVEQELDEELRDYLQASAARRRRVA